jgi:hypothetical protein
MITGWIFDGNLRPFLTVIGWIVGYSFDADDWVALSHGVRESDAEANSWYEYEFVGRYSAHLRLGRDPGSSVVQVRAGVPADVDPQIRLALAIFAHFHVSHGADPQAASPA